MQTGAERSGCTDNVLALLVFTIAFTSLFTLRPIGTPAAAASDQGSNATATEDVPAQVAEWLDAINFLLFVLSAIWSFGAINATSIAYNTCSACSDANATALIKMPSFNKYLQAANNASLFGSFPIAFATIILTLKHIILSYDGRPVAIFLVAGTILVFAKLGRWFVFKYRQADPVVVTHAVMFAGLMGERAVCPDGEEDGVAWALRTPGELIEKFVFNRTLDAIAAEAVVDAEGKRADKKLQKQEIPKRIDATLEGYRRAALSEHYARLGAEQRAETHLPPGAAFVRRKHPMTPGARVAPVLAA